MRNRAPTRRKRLWTLIFALMFALVIGGCDDSEMVKNIPDDDGGETPPPADYAVGVFNTPTGESEPGPAMPGESYTFTFEAPYGAYLSFATMFVRSNDLFYAPDESGIPLFDGQTPVNGEVTNRVYLWDAGTEVNEMPGMGPNQAPDQSGPNTGASEFGTVRRIGDVDDGFTYPAVSEVVRVTLSGVPMEGGGEFTVAVENVSDEGPFQTPLAPGVWVVHTFHAPIFTPGTPDRGEGLEALAEDGDPSLLAATLEEREEAAFTVTVENRTDTLLGMRGGVFNTPEGAADPGPALPGGAYEITFTAPDPESRVSFTTMYGRSNDAFYGPAEGIALYDENGVPWGMNGPMDVTSQVALWDAGTEADQTPGFGSDQPPFTGMTMPMDHPNVGPEDPDPVVRRKTEDGLGRYGSVEEALDVLLTYLGEDTFSLRIENRSDGFTYGAAGMFNTPVGAESPGPAMPGNAYSFSFMAEPGDSLSFATMYVITNDLFFAPAPQGIALFTDGTPASGDVTAQVMLWDAGTEVNEEPGAGPNIAPNQAGPDTGPDENGVVRPIGEVGDGFTYPDPAQVIQVTLTPEAVAGVTEVNGARRFTATLQVLEGAQSPIAPGVWAVHKGTGDLFTPGAPDRGEGLEALAEDGMAADLAEAVGMRTGTASPISPGLYVVHTGGNPLFTEGAVEPGGLEAQAEYGDPAEIWERIGDALGVPTPLSPGIFVVHATGYPLHRYGTADRGEGLEALAEYGTPGPLATTLTGRDGIAVAGTFGDGPILPGEAADFTFTAMNNETLSLATMVVQSNDLFFGTADGGIPLFSGGVPVTGNVTNQMLLWDAGTEVNEVPGAGPNQAPRQDPGLDPGDQGIPENGVVLPVMEVDDGFVHPTAWNAIRVTISAE